MKKWLALAAGVIAAGSTLLALAFTGNLSAAIPGSDNGVAAGGSKNESDKAAIVRLSLEWALVDQNIPDYALLLKDSKNVVLSLENLDATLVPELAGVNLTPLAPQEIQNKANQEGDFLHLRFEQLEIQETRATVNLNNSWAVAEDSNMGYLSGGGCILEFHKEAGQWELEPPRACWIA
jgi:hypothetical protein